MILSTVFEGEFPIGPGPTGPPTGAQTTPVGEEGIDQHAIVTWVNGDLAAATQIGLSPSCAEAFEPTSVYAEVPPQEDNWEAPEGEDCLTGWFVRHARNGQFTAWVYAPCDACEE